MRATRVSPVGNARSVRVAPSARPASFRRAQKILSLLQDQMTPVNASADLGTI
jgi:hypothetical protein